MDARAIRAEGFAAEAKACLHLQWRGWRIAARNWVGGGGELDIVASRWRTLLIVEVRRRLSGTEALASIDRDKLNRTLRAAQALIRRHDLQAYHLRLDLIGIDHQGRLHRRRDVLRNGVLGR
jgi:Holliday junction resolvase-like predicted endonuclease